MESPALEVFKAELHKIDKLFPYNLNYSVILQIQNCLQHSAKCFHIASSLPLSQRKCSALPLPPRSFLTPITIRSQMPRWLTALDLEVAQLLLEVSSISCRSVRLQCSLFQCNCRCVQLDGLRTSSESITEIIDAANDLQFCK